MSIRSILAAEGLVQGKRASNEEAAEEIFNETLQALIESAHLPPVGIFGSKNQKVEVVVPRGFDSLFERVYIELYVEKNRSKGLYGSLSWRYEHPRNGGSNGHTIGRFSVLIESLEAGYRLDGGPYVETNAPFAQGWKA